MRGIKEPQEVEAYRVYFNPTGIIWQGITQSLSLLPTGQIIDNIKRTGRIKANLLKR